MHTTLEDYLALKSKIKVTETQSFLNCFSSESILSAPIKIEISLTNNCNQRCSHCSNSSRIEAYEKVNFNTKWLDRIIDTAPFYCVLTGGEPLMHPCFLEIVKKLKDHNFVVGILSNGTLWNENLMHQLKGVGFSKLDNIQISLDAADENTYRMRRGRSNFADVVKNITLLSLYDFNVDVHFVPTMHTIGQVADVYNLSNECGATSFSTATLAPIGRAKEMGIIPVERLLEEEVGLIQASEKYSTKYLGTLLSEICSYVHLIDSTNDKEKYFPVAAERKNRCAAGRTTAYINEYGDVYTCVYASAYPFQPLGNLSNSGLHEIWTASLNDYSRQEKSATKTICESCKSWGICTGGCIGVSSIIAGTIEVGHDTRCMKIKERYYE